MIIPTSFGIHINDHDLILHIIRGLGSNIVQLSNKALANQLFFASNLLVNFNNKDDNDYKRYSNSSNSLMEDLDKVYVTKTNLSDTNYFSSTSKSVSNYILL